METRVVIDEIVFQPQTGVTLIKLQKQIVDGDKVLASQPHRASLDPGTDSAALMTAVNAHLAQLGYPPVMTGDVEVFDKAITPLADHRAAKAVELAQRLGLSK